MEWILIAALFSTDPDTEPKIQYWYFDTEGECLTQNVTLRMVSVNNQIPVAVIPCHKPEDYEQDEQ